jgi:membrane protein
MPPPRPFLLPFSARIGRRFGEEGFDQISASLAFTTLLSVVPMVGLVLAFVSAFPAFEVVVSQIEQLLISYLLPSGSAELISGRILKFSRRASEVNTFGVVVLVFTAYLLLHTVERALNHVWRVPEPRPMWQRLFLYAVVLAAWPILIGGLLAVISAAVTTSLGWVSLDGWLLAPVFKVISFAALALFFTFIYYAVPNAPVRWREAAIAGGAAALGFVVLQIAFTLYLAYFPSYKTIYGAFATVPIFLLWVYLSWAVVLVGGLIAATLPEFEKPRNRKRRR